MTWRLLIYWCIRCIEFHRANLRRLIVNQLALRKCWNNDESDEWWMGLQSKLMDEKKKKITYADTSGSFWYMAAFAIIKTFTKEWKWSKEKVKPKFQISFLVICHHLCRGNPVANEGKQKNLICCLCSKTKTKRSGTPGFFCLLVCFHWNKNRKMNPLFSQSNMEVYFVILCRQNANPLGQHFSRTH